MLIGRFEFKDNGVIQGVFQTLFNTRTVTFVPVDAPAGEKSPSHRVYLAEAHPHQVEFEIGAAWRKKGKEGDYYSCRFDAPELYGPIYANLYRDGNLVFDDRRKRKQDSASGKTSEGGQGDATATGSGE